LNINLSKRAPVATFWTVPIREASCQKRFLLIIGAFQLTAAARNSVATAIAR
jgi:hypothetical protein